MSSHAIAPRGSVISGGALAALTLAAFITPAAAQGTDCKAVQPQLLERKAIIERLQAHGKKQLDPKFACSTFGQLVSNGSTIVKWIEANKDWCQVPQSFEDGMKSDHGRAVTMRTKACAVAAQQVQMEKKAKEQAQGGGGGLLGGNTLEGQFRLPQGAL